MQRYSVFKNNIYIQPQSSQELRQITQDFHLTCLRHIPHDKVVYKECEIIILPCHAKNVSKNRSHIQ